MHTSGERIVYGDSKGSVVMLLCGTRVWPARDLICQDEYQDYMTVHSDHNDWVSQVVVAGKFRDLHQPSCRPSGELARILAGFASVLCGFMSMGSLSRFTSGCMAVLTGLLAEDAQL
jgi:hypothetical protein